MMNAKINKCRKIFPLLLILLVSKVFCQTQNTNRELELPNMVAPSPTVASLMKFDDVPVNHYTGVPDISENLISTQIDENLSINILLTYHPSGIRVEEYASWVGTGWNISGAGGFVSRVVKGAPDELGGVFSNNYFSSNYNVNTQVFDKINYNNAYQGVSGLANYDNDTESDVFHYNFFGHSGRFIFSFKNGQFIPVLLDKKTSLRIETSYSGNLIDKFVITDDKGYRYHFEEKEISTVYNLSSSRQLGQGGTPSLSGSETVYTSSWHIKKIEDNNGLLLCLFDYYDVIEKTKSITDTRNERYPMHQELLNSVLYHYNGSGLESSLLYPYLLPISTRSTSTSTIATKKIKKIDIVDRAVIDFQIGLGRLDYEDNTGCHLVSALLKDRFNNQVSKVEFQYSNYGTGKRLFLDKIRKQGSSTSVFEETLLSYDSPSMLPKRDSLSKDLWGYYNGYHNLEPFPAMIEPPITGANMSTNRYFASKGVLDEITYPTGGSKHFEFEANTFHKVQSVPNMVYDVPENKVPQYEDIVFNCTPTNTPTSNYTSNYKIIYLQHGAFINFNLSILNAHTSPHGTANPLAYKVKITPMVNNYSFNPSTDPILQNKNLYSTDTSNLRSDYSIALDDCLNGNSSNNCFKTFYISGFYLVEMSGNGLPLNYDIVDYRLNFDWFLYRENSKYNYGGGLRIKSVSFKETPESTSPERKFRYEYSNFNDLNSSSGSMVNLPVFHYFQRRFSMTKDIVYSIIYNRHVPSETEYVNPFSVDYLTTTSRSQNFLTQGSSVGYRNVKVFDSSGGSTNYTYYSPEDVPEPIEIFEYPFTLDMPGNDYKRGLIRKEVVFNNAGKELKQKDFLYEFVEEQPVYAGCKVYMPQYTNCHLTNSDVSNSLNSYGGYQNIMDPPSTIYYTSLCGGLYNSFINIRVQNYIVGWAKLNSVLAKDFYYKGNVQSAVNMTETYTYDYSNRKIERKNVENSLGETLSTIYYYPNNPLVSSRPFVSELTARNIIGNPIVVETLEGNERLSTQETVFKDWDPGAGLHLSTELIKVSKGTAPPEIRIRYNDVDIATGNPLEVQQEGGTKISYLWGYNKTLPIAKIENASNAAIRTALGITDLTLVNEANLAAINNLRTLLPNAMVTTYTYKPLVGIASVTDPKGDKITYHYDSFKRLQFVKDKDGKILSENQYHYRTQN